MAALHTVATIASQNYIPCATSRLARPRRVLLEHAALATSKLCLRGQPLFGSEDMGRQLSLAHLTMVLAPAAPAPSSAVTLGPQDDLQTQARLRI